jgi:hypothetical protein
MSAQGGALAEDAETASQIRWRDGTPLAFLYQTRLYMVRRITGRAPGRWQVVAAAGRSAPLEPFELVLDPVTAAWSVVRLPGEVDGEPNGAPDADEEDADT